MNVRRDLADREINRENGAVRRRCSRMNAVKSPRVIRGTHFHFSYTSLTDCWSRWKRGRVEQKRESYLFPENDRWDEAVCTSVWVKVCKRKKKLKTMTTFFFFF